MRKYRCFFDFTKEEKWLEDMAKEGYYLREANGWSYRFDYCKTPGEFNIKIDYRSFNRDKDFHDYCTIFEDSGWRHVAGTKWSGVQYFVKSRPDAGDDIFSDNLSRAGRYKKCSLMWLSLAVMYFPIMMVFIMTGTINIHKMFHLKSLYLTPGLWELKGMHFLRAFLFETPFALARGFSWTILFVIVLFYGIYALKSYLLYRRETGKNV